MSDSAPGPIILPICTVQHDFQSATQDVLDGIVPDDKFWVSCYKSEEPSVHGGATVTLDDSNRDLLLFKGRDGVEFNGNGKSIYSVSCTALGVKGTRLAVPNATYGSPEDVRKTKQITAFDVAPDGSQFATGYHDGSVFIRPLSSPNATPSFAYKAHLSTVTSLRFFPSSRVVLTSSTDFSLGILSAEPPETPTGYATAKATPARTLRGHTRAVTSTGIIARGRNVLSGSKDGTVRLWDVPSSTQIRSFAVSATHFVPVLALATGERTQGGDGPGDPNVAADLDPREVETQDKVAFCALQDGSFALLDLRTKATEFRSRPAAAPGARAALQAIAYAPAHHLVATGAADGLAAVHDVRALGQGPVAAFRRNGAPIEDVAFVELAGAAFAAEGGAEAGVGLAIATEDGLPYIADVWPHGPGVRAELVGTDCDAVRFARAVGKDVWTASDDGVVRRYAS